MRLDLAETDYSDGDIKTPSNTINTETSEVRN